MSTPQERESVEAVDELLHRPPEEDFGTNTARWYEFQYGCATRHCIEMARAGSGLEWVLCEWHTDYVLGWTDGARSLVSVKHREADSGFWTIARLFSDGGFDTFFKRWRECGCPRESRWITNGGLDPECRKLKEACSSQEVDVLREFSKSMKRRFDCSEQEAFNFLRSLRIFSDNPPTQYLRAVNIEIAVRPALIELNLEAEAAHLAHDAVLSLVRSAAQALDDVQGEWLLTKMGSLDSDSLIKAEIERRSINQKQVLAALHAAALPIAASLPPRALPATRLIKKLSKGEVVPTAISAARRARREWTEFEKGAVPPLPGVRGAIDFRRLRAQVIAEAAKAQQEASESGHPYGNKMLRDMHGRISHLVRGFDASSGVDELTLMGLVYDLTAQCEIWWSEEFNVDDDQTAGE